MRVFLKKGSTYIDGFDTEDQAMAAWRNISNNSGIKITREVAEITSPDYTLQFDTDEEYLKACGLLDGVLHSCNLSDKTISA